jgi:glutaredoxin
MILKLIREGLGRVIVLVDTLTRPAPVQRGEAEQRKVDAAAAGLALYQYHACPFCTKTRRAIHRLNLPIELRDAQNDPEHRRTLEDRGGKIQVPCLHIQEPGEERWLYESRDIIDYLEGRFAPHPEVADAVKQTP